MEPKPHTPVSPSSEANDVNSHSKSGTLAWEQLERERERCKELEEKVEQLTCKIDDDHQHTMSVEKQMREEIRRLNRELRQERERKDLKKSHCRLLITARRIEPPKVKQGL